LEPTFSILRFYVSFFILWAYLVSPHLVLSCEPPGPTSFPPLPRFISTGLIPCNLVLWARRAFPRVLIFRI
jgi:hypothetical protein